MIKIRIAMSYRLKMAIVSTLPGLGTRQQKLNQSNQSWLKNIQETGFLKNNC